VDGKRLLKFNMRNETYRNGQNAVNQVVRRRCTALVIHSHTGTISIKDNDGAWHRHLQEVPQALFLALPPGQRRRIIKAEFTLGRPLVENSRLIVVLDRRPRRPRRKPIDRVIDLSTESQAELFTSQTS
jgi:hypothetical protein